MVHALKETHRVLGKGGILIDLRPAPKHRRVGLGEGAAIHWVGSMREDFDDDRAANQAVAKVRREGLFRRESETDFDLDRLMDSLEDFRAWLDDFGSRNEIPSHEWLYQRLQQAQNRAGAPAPITVRGPLMLSVLRKL